jgi:hypothetical protein
LSNVRDAAATLTPLNYSVVDDSWFGFSRTTQGWPQPAPDACSCTSFSSLPDGSAAAGVCTAADWLIKVLTNNTYKIKYVPQPQKFRRCFLQWIFSVAKGHGSCYSPFTDMFKLDFRLLIGKILNIYFDLSVLNLCRS